MENNTSDHQGAIDIEKMAAVNRLKAMQTSTLKNHLQMLKQSVKETPSIRYCQDVDGFVWKVEEVINEIESILVNKNDE
jgi:deoxyxylulose-5-phosphate synthase